MSIVFLLLKTFGQYLNFEYDKIVFLVLLDLDIIALFTILRWYRFKVLTK